MLGLASLCLDLLCAFRKLVKHPPLVPANMTSWDPVLQGGSNTRNPSLQFRTSGTGQLKNVVGTWFQSWTQICLGEEPWVGAYWKDCLVTLL